MSHTIESQDPLFNSKQTRQYLGDRSDMTLWRWVRDEVIPPPIKIRRRNYWRKSSLDSAISKQSSDAVA